MAGLSDVMEEVPPPPPQDEVMSVHRSWCYTRVKLLKITYSWTIRNFRFCREQTGELIQSDIFSTSTNEKHKCASKWRLIASPKGLDEECKDYVSLHLQLVSYKNSEVRAKFKFSILNAKQEEVAALKSQRAYRFVDGKEWGFRKFVQRDFLLDKANHLLPDDNLTVLCEVIIVVGTVNTFGSNNDRCQKVPQCTLSDDMEKLLESGKFSDVVLTVNGREVRAHKAILAFRSPTFGVIFENTSDDSTENRVEIMDVSYNVLREVLLYIYTDRVPNMERMAFDLLAAANKFGLERLKVLCEEVLCSKLTVTSAAEMLTLADAEEAEQLKAHALKFISTKYPRNVMETPGWLKMCAQQPHLVEQVFRALASQPIPPLGPPRKRMKHS